MLERRDVSPSFQCSVSESNGDRRMLRAIAQREQDNVQASMWLPRTQAGRELHVKRARSPTHKVVWLPDAGKVDFQPGRYFSVARDKIPPGQRMLLSTSTWQRSGISAGKAKHVTADRKSGDNRQLATSKLQFSSRSPRLCLEHHICFQPITAWYIMTRFLSYLSPEGAGGRRVRMMNAAGSRIVKGQNQSSTPDRPGSSMSLSPTQFYFLDFRCLFTGFSRA